MGNYYLFMLTETQNLRIKRLIIFPSAINSLIVLFKLLFICLTVQQTFSIVNFKARCQCLLWCCLCDFDCYKCIKVITRALSDTLQKLLYKYILHQIQPMILLLIFSYSTDLSYFPALLLFMYFWVLNLITSKPVKNMKEWTCTHLLQIVYYIFLFSVYNRNSESP